MASLRETIAMEAKVGSVKFWAKRANPQPTPRRLAQYIGVGVTGASLEDLGRNARVEILTAEVTEDIYVDLDFIKDAAKVITIQHPLFGVFEGRLADVTYDAGPNDMVDIVCTCIEDGDPKVLFVPAANTTAQKKQSADSTFDNLTLSAFDAAPTSSGLPSASASLDSSFSSLSAVMDAVSSADALWADASAAFSDLASAGDVFIDAVDSFQDATQEMVDMVDTTYELINTAREWVDAVENQVAGVWQNMRITTPLSIAEIALGLVGKDDEDTIDLILSRNPTLIDLNAVPVGFELSIPISL